MLAVDAIGIIFLLTPLEKSSLLLPNELPSLLESICVLYDPWMDSHLSDIILPLQKHGRLAALHGRYHHLSSSEAVPFFCSSYLWPCSHGW